MTHFAHDHPSDPAPVRGKEVAAKAIIHWQRRILLQYRDCDPHIYHPGYWGFFGGLLEERESPEQGLVRELEEELGWRVPRCDYLLTWRPDEQVIIYLYLAELDVPLSALRLGEGAGMALVSTAEIQTWKLAPEVHLHLEEIDRRIGVMI